MTLTAAVLSAIGGGAGASVRAYVLAEAELAGVQRLDRAIAAVNVIGSTLAGMLLAAGLSPALLALLLTGVLGGFTTLSSWISALTTQRPPEERTRALLWAASDLLAGLAGAAAGYWVVSALG
ncbi:MAG: CrcB family protein [Solirubrobacteraceae bacterium]|nr:CrcB family protein [Solirubrobacteraceae bacterium]